MTTDTTALAAAEAEAAPTESPAAKPATARAKPPKAPAMAPIGPAKMQITDPIKRKAFADIFGRDYLHNFDDPIVFHSAEFYAVAVRQSFKRDFALISRTMYSEYVYRRRPAFDQAKLDRFGTLISTKLANIQELLSRDYSRIAELCRINGQPVDAGYLDSQSRVAPIIHASAFQYVRALEMLDKLLQVTGSATLYGVISADQRRLAEVRARRAIYAFSTLMRQESARLNNEYKRSLGAGDDDQEAREASEMVEKAQAEYDAQAARAPGESSTPESLDAMVAESRAVEAATGVAAEA